MLVKIDITPSLHQWTITVKTSLAQGRCRCGYRTPWYAASDLGVLKIGLQAHESASTPPGDQPGGKLRLTYRPGLPGPPW